MNALLSLASRLLWPSLPIKVLWLLLVAASILGLLSEQPKLVVVPLSCLVLLIFCIPLQFMQMRHKRSWLLLPYFKQHARLLLLAVTLLIGLLSGALMYLAAQRFWLGFQFGVLAFAALILPCLLYGNLRPLLLNSALLVVLFASKVLDMLPVQHPINPIVILAVINMLLLGWFWFTWLKPVKGKTITRVANCNPAANWLLQFTRKPATLSGSLLLGQGDSWQARVLRCVAYCWYLPGFMLIWSVFFNSGAMPEQSFLRAIFVLFPGFLLTDQLANMFRRVRRSWLQLASNRQQLFFTLERHALKELFVAALVITPLISWLLPSKTAIAMILLWPSLILFNLYLSWRLINVSVFWSGGALVALNILAVTTLTLCWQQPGYLILAAALLVGSTLQLRKKVRRSSQTQDWAKLKVLKQQQIRTGL